MAKSTDGARGANKPFLARWNGRVEQVNTMLEKVKRHADAAKDGKAAALVEAGTLYVKAFKAFADGKKVEAFKLEGVKAQANRGWAVGDKLTIKKDFAFVYPTVKPGAVVTVKGIKAVGDDKAKKYYLLTDAGVVGPASHFDKS